MHCPKLHLPAHGALVCNGGLDLKTRFCIATCQSGYDFAVPPGWFYICTDQGKWVSIGGSQQVPDCSGKGNSRVLGTTFRTLVGSSATELLGTLMVRIVFSSSVVERRSD